MKQILEVTLTLVSGMLLKFERLETVGLDFPPITMESDHKETS